MKYYLLIPICLIWQLLSYSQVNLNSGLVAYYPFNGNANDASGNGNNAIVTNATLTSDRLGNANSAYSFNGIDNYIRIPNNQSINPSNQISLCVFVNPKGFYQGPCHGNSILMKGDANYLPGNYALRFDDNAFTSQNNCNTVIVDSLHQNFYSNAAQTPSPGYTPYINKNQWYSIVFTYDGAIAKFYVDGVLKFSEVRSLSFINSYDLFLGRLNDASFPYWFNGIMDEVRIYNRAINAAEVNAYANPGANKAPEITITNPANNVTYTSPATFSLNATASDQDGSITSVQFYSGATLLATVSTSPYSFTLTGLAIGNYSFVAKAIDNNGLVSNSATVAVSVVASPNRAPVVNITDPVNNATYIAPAAGASITINATATDPDGAIANVKFFNGSTLLATDSISPYSYTLNNAPPGNYKFYAQATDNNGLKNSSSTVSAFVVPGAANKAPTVNITSPSNNRNYPAIATIVLHAEASDEDGTITRVQFYQGSTLIKTDSSSPYSCTITHPPTGNYSFVAKAIDNNGLVSNSATVNVQVGSASNKAPVVTISTPENNASFIAGSTIILNAKASDPDGTISDVKFFNGNTLLTIDSTAPYSYTMNNVVTGTYKFYAKATDNTGLSSSSSTVSVFVVPGASNKAPVVSLVDPANNEIHYAPVTGGTILMNAEASDPDGTISNVKFYMGSTLLATDSTAPYSYTLTNLPEGNYSFVAKATDNNGLVSNSSTAVCPVLASPNKAPAISIISPANNTIYTSPANITLSAAASDTDGSITNVKFYNGSTFLKTVSKSPYNYTLNNLPVGGYKFYAKATDNNGLTNASATVYVVVTSQTSPPCPAASQPTFGYKLNGNPLFNINNGLSDASESASLTLCDGGQYTESGRFHNSLSTLYNITFVHSGGTLLFNGYPCANAVITADQYNKLQGTVTVLLADHNAGGSVIETVTPFTDLNNNGIFDVGDCKGDPITITYTATPCTSPGCPAAFQPIFGYKINGTPLFNINNGLSDPSESASLTICDGGQYTESGRFHSSLSTLYNITFVFSGGTLLFDGSKCANAVLTADQYNELQGTVTILLADPNTGGSVVETISPFTDLNNNRIMDVGDCRGDPITITYTATPCPGPKCPVASEPTFGYKFNGTPLFNINNGLSDPSESGSIIICNGGQYTQSDRFHSSPSNSYNLNYVLSGGTVLFNGYKCANAVITAEGYKLIPGTVTVSLTHPDRGGSVVETVTPFTDLNNNGILDVGDCKGDPIVFTYTVIPCQGKNSLALSQSSSVDIKAPVVDRISMKLLPNPAHNILNIYITGLQSINKQTISIISSSGVVMKSIQTSSLGKAIQLNVSSLAGGMYIIKMVSVDKVMYRQFIKY